MAKKRKPKSVKILEKWVPFNPEKTPLIFSSLVFGFAISAGRILNKPFGIGSVFEFFFGVIVSYLFIVFTYRLFSRLLKKTHARVERAVNNINLIASFMLAISTGGSILFMDLLNTNIRFVRPYKAFQKKGRYNVEDEAWYRFMFILVFMVMTAVFYGLQVFAPNILFEFLFKLSIWNMIWSVVPLFGLFSFFIMVTITDTLATDAEHYIRATGATKMFVGSSRVWSFIMPLSITFGLMLLFNFGLIFSFLIAFSLATLILLLWMGLIDFPMKRSVLK